MPMLITERIEFCKEIRLVKLRLFPKSPHLYQVTPRQPYMEFQIETASGKILQAERVTILLTCHYERWQRQVVITGIDKRLDRLRIGLELTTPTVDPFGMIQSEWFEYRLHIPSCLPLQPYRMYENFKIHQSYFE